MIFFQLTHIKLKTPYLTQGVSELIARHLRPYNLTAFHKPTESARRVPVHVKDPFPTQRRRNIVCRVPCFKCPSAYVGQTGTSRCRQANFLPAIHCLTAGHTFDWIRASAVLFFFFFILLSNGRNGHEGQ